VRIRSVVPAFWSSLTLAKVPRDLRLFFIGLWSCADDHGRGLADPRWLKGQLFSFDDDVTPATLQDWLTRLADPDVGVIVLYQGPKGQPLYAIPSWAEHQHPQKKKDSKLPSPPDGSGLSASSPQGDTGTVRVPEASSDRPPRARERSGQEGRGKERSGEGGNSPSRGNSLPRGKAP
jgi:hypothetical protein